MAQPGRMPEYERFATVDEQLAVVRELAERYPERARLRRIGTSALGEPLVCLTVDGGEKHAVVFGSPHPNEPIGNLTALHLARTLCEDAALRERLGLTWHIVPCADPDGTRLNEGWFAGPFAREHYGRFFYRPAPAEQVEWTFPFSYKRAYFDRVLPETLALMRLIDDVRPALLCPLHNSELGGVYYYLSEPAPELYPELHRVARQVGIPLDIGEPEVAFAERYADAIFGLVRNRDAYEHAVRHGLDPTHRTKGCSSGEYASRHGTMTVISELPYWTHPSADDRTLTETPYSDVLRARAEGVGALGELLQGTLDAVGDELCGKSPFERATRAFIPSLLDIAAADRARAGDEPRDRRATVAEAFSCADLVHCFRIRYGGMLLRALEAQLAIGNGRPAIRRELATLTGTYAGWCERAAAESPATPIPIRDVVAVQYGAILATARYLAGRAC
jgi:hypothetical protein